MPENVVSCSTSAPGWPYQLNRSKKRPTTKFTRGTKPLALEKSGLTPWISPWLPCERPVRSYRVASHIKPARAPAGSLVHDSTTWSCVNHSFRQITRKSLPKTRL